MLLLSCGVFAVMSLLPLKQSNLEMWFFVSLTPVGTASSKRTWKGLELPDHLPLLTGLPLFNIPSLSLNWREGRVVRGGKLLIGGEGERREGSPAQTYTAFVRCPGLPFPASAGWQYAFFQLPPGWLLLFSWPGPKWVQILENSGQRSQLRSSSLLFTGKLGSEEARAARPFGQLTFGGRTSPIKTKHRNNSLKPLVGQLSQRRTPPIPKMKENKMTKWRIDFAIKQIPGTSLS